MTDDVMDRLRASDPLPAGSAAPPVEEMLARLDLGRPPKPRWRPIGVLAPVLSAAVVVVIVVVALTTVRTRHPRAHAGSQSSASTAALRGGMRGLVTVWGAGFSSNSDGVISLQQCLGCRDGNQTAHSTDLYWLARTTNGGRSWSLEPERYYILQPLFAGANGWAGGLEATGSKDGGFAEYYVTHDGGRSWRIAPTAAPNEGDAPVSLVGSEVWATGLTATNVAILHAPVTANRLEAAASQPIHGNWTNVDVTAAGPGTAYVQNADRPRQTFVTHDDGRSWQRIPPPCARVGRGVPIAAHGDTVWATCVPTNPNRGESSDLVRSTDGGRNWQPLGAVPAITIQAVSARIAWLFTIGGQVWRTTDAGRTWHPVWSASSEPSALRAHSPSIASGNLGPALIAQSPTSASVLTLVTYRHDGKQLTNLVLYRTTDGGRTWQPYTVPLAKH
jgi:photosystem II stability/assembly factor-like uncharacterized protein